MDTETDVIPEQSIIADAVIVKSESSMDGEHWNRIQNIILDGLKDFENDYCKLSVYKQKTLKTVDNRSVGIALAAYTIKLEEFDLDLREQQTDYISKLDDRIKDSMEPLNTESIAVIIEGDPDKSSNRSFMMFESKDENDVRDILSESADEFIKAFESDFNADQERRTKVYFKTFLLSVSLWTNDEDWKDMQANIMSFVEKECKNGIKLLYLNHSGLKNPYMRTDFYFVVLMFRGLDNSDIVEVNENMISIIKDVEIDTKIKYSVKCKDNVSAIYTHDEFMSCKPENIEEVKKEMSELSKQMFDAIKKDNATSDSGEKNVDVEDDE